MTNKNRQRQEQKKILYGNDKQREQQFFDTRERVPFRFVTRA